MTNSIIVNNPTYASNMERVHAEVIVNGKTHEIYFQTDPGLLSTNLEGFLAAALTPAMRLGSDIQINGKVSPWFLLSYSAVQQFFSEWYPDYKQIKVIGGIPEEKQQPKERRIGAYFSGGVDSFYSLIKHRQDITDIIFIEGYDTQLENQDRNKTLIENVRKVAAHFGKRAVIVRTNMHDFVTLYAEWLVAHETALATVGLLLTPLFERIYIPASYSPATLCKWPQHPLIDPLWTTESITFIHDGFEASRVQKIVIIAGEEIVHKSLRVCVKNPKSHLNCGKCAKCQRTMITLAAFGILENFSVFEHPLDRKRIYKLNMRNDHERPFVVENLKLLEERHVLPEIAYSLKRTLHMPGIYFRLLRGFRKIRRLLD